MARATVRIPRGTQVSSRSQRFLATYATEFAGADERIEPESRASEVFQTVGRGLMLESRVGTPQRGPFASWEMAGP